MVHLKHNTRQHIAHMEGTSIARIWLWLEIMGPLGRAWHLGEARSSKGLTCKMWKHLCAVKHRAIKRAINAEL